MTKEFLRVCETLNTSFLLFNQIHPIDDKLLNNILKNYENIVVVEDQLSGIGLYNSLCEKLINNSHGKFFYSLSPESFNLKVGKNADFFLKDHKIDSNSISEFVKKI